MLQDQRKESLLLTQETEHLKKTTNKETTMKIGIQTKNYTFCLEAERNRAPVKFQCTSRSVQISKK